MASKAHVDVAERRLRPVYDALDNLNNKQAIKLADNILRKQKDFHCAKALKALALVRCKKEHEAEILLDEIRETCTDFDESTLQAMSLSYKETLNANAIRTLYEIAVKQSPNNEEYLSHLFMACVRVNDYNKQQKAAMNLYKAFPKNPYYFWAVMSTYMQALTSGEDKKKNMYLSLAERMIEKFIKEGKVDAEEEIRLYMMILEKLEKYEELVKLLLGDFKEKLKYYMLEKEEKLIEYYTHLKNWGEVNIGCKNMLIENADNWIYYMKYFDSFFCLWEIKYTPDKPIDTENIQPDYTKELCEEFLNTLDKDNKLLRGPSLAKLEFNRRWSKETNTELDQDVLLEEIVLYFEKFGSKPCCFTDLRQFAIHLNQEYRIKLIERLNDKVIVVDEESEIKVKVKSLYQEICIECLCMQLEIYKDLSVTEKFQKAVLYMTRYNKSLKLGCDLNSTEAQYGDTLVLLCVHTLLKINKEKGDDNMFWHMLLFLEEAVECSRTYPQFRLLLIFLYSNLGAYGAVAELIDEIEIKYSMYDSLGYFLGHSSYLSGQFQATRNLYAASHGLYHANRKDTPEQIIASYKYGSFRQITDMVNFHNKVEHSFQHYHIQIESMYVDLLQYTNSLNEVKDTVDSIVSQLKLVDGNKISIKELADNRDLQVFDVFNVKNRDTIEKKKEETFPVKVYWLKYRYLVLKALVSCFNDDDDDKTVNESFNDVISDLEAIVIELKKYKTSFDWTTIEEPPPCWMNLFFDQNHDVVMLLILKVRSLLVSHECGENDEKIKQHLEKCSEILEDNFKKFADTVVMKKNDDVNSMFNGKSLQYIICWLEMTNFVFIVLTHLKEYINSKFLRRGKKKKTNQQTVSKHEAISVCIKNVLSSAIDIVKKLESDLNEVQSKYIDENVESEAIEELFEKTNSTTVTKVWKKLQTSYKQSVMEIIQLLQLKTKFIMSLPR